MEEDQELKHSCKFCNKGFPCGRSLGGHMRSHMITNNNSNSAETTTHGKKFAKKKLPSLNNGGGETAACYSLRENPKKTRRLADTSEDTSSLYDKFCKESVKGSLSWKTSEDEEDSWTSGANQKLVMDTQSDNETAPLNRKRRSKRRTRYMATAISSSFSVADNNNNYNNNNGSSSVSEIEQEQEEVAMCLMMLSRDMGSRSCLNSVAESSDNNSVFLEAKLDGGGEFIKKKKKQQQLKAGFVDSENCQFDENCKKSMKETKLGSNKHKKVSDAALKDSTDTTELLKDSEKRSKFECSSCNKIFHSYQALGGHRASHKKIKGCFASKIDSSENSIETQLSPDPTADSSKLVKSGANENSIDHLVADCHHTKRHECPICLKVFSSGQALGGHKRSHLLNVNETRSNPTTVIKKPPPLPEIRNLLDLNLPASAEEDSNSGHLGFKPWWIDSSHKHEALVGLISN